MASTKMNFLTIITILIWTLVAESETSTPIRKCNNGKPLPLSVQINDCETLPCDFFKGRQTNMAIQFVATKNSMDQLRADVRLTTLGAQIPFDLEKDRSNICKNLLFGAYCPLDAGEDVTYHLILQVNGQQPEVPIKLEVNLVDNRDDSIVACFVTDGRVKRFQSITKLSSME